MLKIYIICMFITIFILSLLIFSACGFHNKYKAKIDCEDLGGLLIERHINNFVCINPTIIKTYEN